jgi:glucokinase-like ROK family protein
LYGLRGDSRYVVGIDISRLDTRIAVFNLANQLVAPIAEFAIDLADEPNLISSIHQALHEVIENHTIDYQKVIALGIDMPGLIDSQRGINHSRMATTGPLTLAEEFAQALGKPCFLENDSRVMALGEYRFGLAQGRNNVMCLKVSWGVGLGMILDGRVYHGHSGFAGEFGHIQLVPDGELCSCGKRGCLETVSSAKALTRYAHDGLAQGRVSILSDKYAGHTDHITAHDIIEAAHRGDEFSIHILSKIGRELGRGLATLIHLTNPEAIIIGGLMAQAEQYITAPLQHAINKYCIPHIGREVEIMVSELRRQSGVMGAAALVWERLLDDAPAD